MTVGRIPVIEGGIQPTIFDAKADLLTATANDTPARLAVGANDTLLTADSTATTGLKWAAAPGSVYVSYTPSTSGITVGNGTLVGSYVKNGKFVSGYARFTMGSTSAITGQIIVALPSATENGNLQFTVIIGDSGSATYSGFGEIVGGNVYVYAMLSNSTYVSGAGTSATVPMTWTTNDFVQVTFTYKEA
jgi:hypothetical protein